MESFGTSGTRTGRFPFKIRKEIVKYAETSSLLKPNEVMTPSEESEPLEGLTLSVELRCADCSYACVTEWAMQVHSKLMHGWVKARGVRWKSQPVQTFFQGSNLKYFAVSAPENHVSSFTNVESSIERVLGKASDHDENYEQTFNRVSDMQSLVTKGPWLRRTGWDRMFIGKDVDVFVPLSCKAIKAESGLNLVCQSVERVIKSCRNGVQDCVDRNWGLIPFWLASVERHKGETRPF